MATPIRLALELHNFKSARAGCDIKPRTSAHPPKVRAKPLPRTRQVAGRALRLVSGIDEDGPKIVDIRVCWSAHNKIAERLEEWRGVIVVEKVLGVEMAEAGPGQRVG
jgi:hypothetical protein